jgi:Domain of unknown function (DUF2383)
VSGSVHQAWTNIKSAITGMDEAAILAECEQGEDVAKGVYKAALEKDLPLNVRTVIQRQFLGLRKARPGSEAQRSLAAGNRIGNEVIVFKPAQPAPAAASTLGVRSS